MKGLSVLVTIIIVMAMAACDTPTVPEDDNTSAVGEENKAIVDKYIQASLTGDVGTMEQFMAPNFKDHGPVKGDTTSRSRYLERTQKNWQETFASMKYNRISALAHTEEAGPLKGDWVLEWGTLGVTYKNGRPPVSIKIHVVYKIKDGKIVYSSSYYNEADALKQQGYAFVLKDEPVKEKVID
ncbi:ester cyclase [Chryseolinea lacunae]|uniref:Ester cyclase n=1 Tax=Chryseolinea lacunae TaxID=2801331 RepID=A0ABS1KPG5_9BACT|nr:ester cyclase [Chryseolinea lacunae]MBL0741218.1 ester cyclase [Chryseolinea lacunae]